MEKSGRLCCRIYVVACDGWGESSWSVVLEATFKRVRATRTNASDVSHRRTAKAAWTWGGGVLSGICLTFLMGIRISKLEASRGLTKSPTLNEDRQSTRHWTLEVLSTSSNSTSSLGAPACIFLYLRVKVGTLFSIITNVEWFQGDNGGLAKSREKLDRRVFLLRALPTHLFAQTKARRRTQYPGSSCVWLQVSRSQWERILTKQVHGCQTGSGIPLISRSVGNVTDNVARNWW